MFDQAVLINHGSTDKSVEIIKSMAPNWKIIDSSLESFDAVLTDFEVQKIEDGIDGWKICLNTTEFIFGSLQNVLKKYELLGIRALMPRSFIMVDKEPGSTLNSNLALLDQKPFGVPDGVVYHFFMREKKIRDLVRRIKRPKWRHNGRSRLLHSHRIGGYSVGRHQWVHSSIPINELSICWFGFSPWNSGFINRKLAIKDKLPTENLHLGFQHRWDLTQMHNVYKRHALLARFFGIDVRSIIDR